MLLYCVRHGETDWNVEQRFQGQRDIPLNDRGRRQATANGLTLARLIGDRIAEFRFVSSPLGRALDTMERIRIAMGLDPAGYDMDERLIEVSYGRWEGRTLAEIGRDDPGQIARRAAAKWTFLPPGDDAESYAMLSKRVESWLRDIQQPTVAVTHGGVIRTLFHLVGGLSGEEAAAGRIPQDQVLKIEACSVRWLETVS